MKKKLILIILLLLFICGCSSHESNDKSSFQIYFFSVGHGDAALIMCDGHNMMIDCGSTNYNEGIQSMYNKLDELQINEFDYIFVSHPDKDHYSLFKNILENRTIKKEVFCSATSDVVNKNDFNSFENTFKTLFKKVSVPKVEDSYKLGTATIDVLAVNTKKYIENSNDSSIVLMITYGNNKFLFTGDAEKYTEQEIKDKNIKCDVLKVAHHGSYTSTSESFLYAANPKYAIFSLAGDDIINGDILDSLEELGTTSLRTDERGLIICSSDGTNITLTDNFGNILN